MSDISTLHRSFAGGEISPEMLGRIDDVKFQTGVAKCLNLIIRPQGPAENRAGFRFVREVKDSTKKTRLIPFTYSTTQTMVIELGEGYCRFHTQGATLLDGGVPYEVANPYAEADLFDIHYVQSADVLTLVHPNYAPRELRRLGATNWELTTIAFTPSVTPPADIVVTDNGKGTDYFYQYAVTALADEEGKEESIASDPGLGDSFAITGATQANPAVITTGVAHGLQVGMDVYIDGVVGMTELNGNYYTVAAVPTTTTFEINDATGTRIDSTAFGAYTSGGTVHWGGVKNNIFTTGAVNTITWSPVVGANTYRVYKRQGGLYGFIGETSGATFLDDNIEPDLSKTPPRYDDGVFDGVDDYPGAVSYYGQRRVFAGTVNQPQNFWLTKSGTESNLSYSLPVKDDDRIAFRIAAREANTIRHIVPLTELILLTSSAEFRVTPVNSDVIAPSTISVKPQAYVGASNTQPVIVNNTLLYCAARGGHLRELGYNEQAGGFVTGDASLRATHLFDTYDLVDMAYAKAPHPIIWMVSTSGKLLGITYVPEQQIGAWHQHDTDGVFESCTVVAEGNEDVLYCVIQRTINGNTVRYIEQQASRQFVDPADAFFVDCGATYDGAPADQISGLDHLEGKTVNILADGAVHPQRVVTSGAVTLDVEASKVQIGLPITADLQTLPLVAQIDNAFGQGRCKNINKVWLSVFRSSGIFAGPTFNRLAEAKQRTTEPYGSPPALKSEDVPIDLFPSWSDTGQVCVRQVDPLPLTILALTIEAAIGG